MNWYWWLLLAVVLFLVVRTAIKAGQKPAKEELAFLDRRRSEIADSNGELGKVVDAVAALPVIGSHSASGNTVSQVELSPSIHNFLESKLRTEWSTQTKMVEVVLSPTRVTIFAKLQPTKPQAAAREFIRVADDTWTFRTRQVEDMETAILHAEDESKS